MAGTVRGATDGRREARGHLWKKAPKPPLWAHFRLRRGTSPYSVYAHGPDQRGQFSRLLANRSLTAGVVAERVTRSSLKVCFDDQLGANDE